LVYLEAALRRLDVFRETLVLPDPKRGQDHEQIPIENFMENPQIVAYVKTQCGWSHGVRAVLKKYDLPYEEKDIIQNPAFRWEMEQKSGQPLSPCVEVNGTMLADVSGEELEEYLVSNQLVQANSAATDVPLNAPCPPEQHEAPNVVFRR
jgi:glutaredoxin